MANALISLDLAHYPVPFRAFFNQTVEERHKTLAVIENWNAYLIQYKDVYDPEQLSADLNHVLGGLPTQATCPIGYDWNHHLILDSALFINQIKHARMVKAKSESDLKLPGLTLSTQIETCVISKRQKCNENSPLLAKVLYLEKSDRDSLSPMLMSELNILNAQKARFQQDKARYLPFLNKRAKASEDVEFLNDVLCNQVLKKNVKINFKKACI